MSIVGTSLWRCTVRLHVSAYVTVWRTKVIPELCQEIRYHKRVCDRRAKRLCKFNAPLSEFRTQFVELALPRRSGDWKIETLGNMECQFHIFIVWKVIILLSQLKFHSSPNSIKFFKRYSRNCSFDADSKCTLLLSQKLQRSLEKSQSIINYVEILKNGELILLSKRGRHRRLAPCNIASESIAFWA